MKNIYILGAGVQAKETYQIYSDNGLARNVAGFIVTLPGFRGGVLRGKKVYTSKVFREVPGGSLFIAAVGNSFKRRELVKSVGINSFNYDTLVHKSARVGDRVEIGEGTTICAESILTCDIKIGKHVLINIGCLISHDVELGDYVSLASGVNLAGRVGIGDGSWIGIGSSVIEDVTIGKNCFLGAGSIVVEDIPDNSLAYGVPARVIKKIDKTDWEKLI